MSSFRQSNWNSSKPRTLLENSDFSNVITLFKKAETLQMKGNLEFTPKSKEVTVTTQFGCLYCRTDRLRYTDVLV